MSTPLSVAFIGLGRMGYPMAGHLARAGHRVTVFNRTQATADRWLATYGGTSAATAADAARNAALVFACVGNDDDVRAVTVGPNGAFSAMASGSVFVDHTTASATVARALAAAAAERGLGFLDAPVTGGQAGAEQGTLTIMVGGDATVFGRVEPILAAYAKLARLMGPSGAGQLTKMVNQICIGGLVEALAEAIHFARRAGLDPTAAMELIGTGAASSWQLVNRHASMIDGRFGFGFAVDLVRKDFGIVFDEARRNGARLPVTALVDQFYAEVQAMGGGRWDTSSLLARLEAASTTSR